MRITRAGRFAPTILSLATAYADQGAEAGDELVIPETFDGLDYAAVQELYSSAISAFDAMYAEADRSPERNKQLAELTDGIESISAELARRDAEVAEREQEAAGYAERIAALRANTESDEDEDGSADDAGESDSDGSDEDADEQPAEEETDENAAQTVVASGSRARGTTRIPLSGIKRQAPKAPQAPKPSMRDVAISAGEGTGFATGQGMDFLEIGKAIDRKLQGYGATQFANAHRQGRQLKEQHGIVAFQRDFAPEMTISSTDRDHVERVLSHATDESRLVGANGQRGLVAAGGWCAPSETLYDLLELETRDGMLSLPEVGISRGGIHYTTGPDFASLYSEITGFSFTEAEDVAGEYEPGADGNVVGPKPCYVVDCPDFTEARLGVDGLCIQAGLLMARGYPEVIARTVRGAMIAHEHRVNGRMIARMVADSTAINMGNQAGTAAPVLDSIEKQVEHYRAAHRLGRGTSLEAVFPFWVRGAIRSDLSRRLGVDLLDVPDSRIDAWFAQRGVNPQFVYNWQAIDAGAATAFTAWPSTVSFLLYSAGTWVRGSSPVITLDTLYDSTLLANNDFTALFTEEGWLVAKRGFDSRVVTVGITADGVTHMGQDIAHNGTLVTP